MAKVLLGGAATKKELPQQGVTKTASITAPLLALGLALSAVALIDLSFVWFPLRIGSPEWEFATIARTFDALALGTVGLVLILLSVVRGGHRTGLALLAALMTTVTLVLFGAVLIYALNVTVALGAVPAEAKSALLRAIARTGTLMFVYVTLYGWLSWFTWRRLGATTKETVS